MPNFTLAEIMSQATLRAGRRADLSQSDVSFWANAAYNEVAELTEYALQERIAVSSTTSGENRVDLPNDFDSLVNLSITKGADGNDSNHTLRMVSEDYVDARGFTPNAEPQQFVLYNNWLELYPSPDSGYSLQLRYRSFATDLLATTDIPSLTTPWRQAVLYLTEAHVWALANNPIQESLARQRYTNYVSQLENIHAKRQKETETRLAPAYPEVRNVSKRSFDVV